MKFRGPQALVDTRVRPFSFLSRKRIYFKTQRLIDSVTRTGKRGSRVLPALFVVVSGAAPELLG